MDNRRESVVQKLEETISNFENKNFNMYFFVMDTKGNPQSGVEYMYNIALNLHESGYNVTMLHQEQEFVGPFDWLGERYTVLPHANVEQSNVTITPADFLFIPEVYTNVMSQTKELPCRRVVVCRNPELMLEFIPVGATWADLNIFDAIVPSSQVGDMLKGWFPNLRTHLVRPSVRTAFYTDENPKQLIVNLITKDRSILNKILKPFFWRFPAYKWVSFRDMASPMETELFPKVLREGAIAVWVDDETTNALSAFEALKSGNILIAKVPDIVPEWMLVDGELRPDVIWFDDFNNLHGILASVIRGWTRNDIKDEFMTVYKTLDNIYTPEFHKSDIEKVILDGIVKERVGEYKQILAGMKNNEVNNE